MMTQKRKIALLHLLTYFLNYSIITYLFIKSYFSSALVLKDFILTILGFIISLIAFIYVEVRINKTF